MCHFGTYLRIAYSVKIRPFWDWNYQLGVHGVCEAEVKIRPFWDWNYFDRGAEMAKIELKSDHFGIEIISR